MDVHWRSHVIDYHDCNDGVNTWCKEIKCCWIESLELLLSLIRNRNAKVRIKERYRGKRGKERGKR